MKKRENLNEKSSSKSWAKSNLGCLILLIGAFSLGLFFIIRSLNTYIHTNKAVKWPTTSGVIIQGGYVGKVNVGFSPGSTYYNYRVHLPYKYNINGKAYTGSNWGAFNPGPTRNPMVFSYEADAKAYLMAFPVGKTITVHYAPKNPKNSIINPVPLKKLPFSFWYGVIIVGALIIFIAAAIISAIKDNRKLESASFQLNSDHS